MAMTTHPDDLDPDLGLVLDFLNTLDVDEDTDELADLESARAWFANQPLALLPAGSGVGPRDLERMRELRAALRELATGHHDGEPDPAAALRFDEVAQRLPLRATIDEGGQPRLEAGGEGADRALARVVIAVLRATAHGQWHRVKVCPADDCAWAFVDRSKNRSRRWCSMGVCGNREKTRAYRERHRT
jgi:predicted RNA-binding Zn ribbon-like protein